MKIKVSKEALSAGLQKVQSVINPKNPMQVLSNVLLRAGDGGLELTATDTDITVRAKVAAEVLEDGAATLPANGEMTLDVPYTGNMDDLVNVRVPVVTANALTGAKWRVTLNGAAVPSGYVGTASVRDGVVYACVSRGGTCIIFR